MTIPTIELKAEKPTLVKGEKQTVDLLVRITPPDVEGATVRPHLNIGIALDRSGSMGGQKMQEAREAAKYCVDQLLPSDRFSAVIFDDVVNVLFTNQLVTDREMLKRGIDRIEHRNSTDLHGGWAQAGLQVSEKLDPRSVNRVLLITDGQANVGETRVDALVSQARDAAERGVSTTTIGIGSDFNEDLLMPMAEAGQGNAWHVQEAADMAKIFETELSGLVRQTGHSVRLSFQGADGVRVIDALNDFEKDRDKYILPNLLAGSPTDVVLRIEIPADAAVDGEKAVLRLEYIDQKSGTAAFAEGRFSPVFGSRAESDAAAPDSMVAEIVRLMMNARARKEAVERMDAGDHDGSFYTLKSVLEETEMAAAAAPSAAYSAELDDLRELSERVARRTDPAMSRKMGLYQRLSRRNSRPKAD